VTWRRVQRSGDGMTRVDRKSCKLVQQHRP